MKRILFLHSSADLYGASKVLLSIVRSCDKKTIEVFVILPYQEALDVKLSSLGAKVIIGPLAVLRRQNFNPLGIARFVAEFVRSIFFIYRLDRIYRFDLIYSNTSTVISGAFYSGLFRKKHIWHIHEIVLRPKIYNLIMPILINMLSTLCICVSYAVERYVRSSKIKRSNIQTVHYGTDLLKDIRETRIDPRSNVTIGMIGRFNRLKGQEIFVKAASQIIQDGGNFQFLIVGSPFKNETKYLEAVERLISDLNLKDKIGIIAFTENITSIYNLLDIVVIPSTQPDSFPTVALEAMAMKKPVIASNIGGLPEMVIDGKTGILVNPSDAGQLKNAIDRLARDGDLRKKMGEAGYERQNRYFNIVDFQHKIDELIKELL